MRSKSLSIYATAAAMALCLVGCAQNPALPERDLGHGWALERQLIKGLTRVQASTDQRNAVLAVFDRVDPTLERLSRESAGLRVMWAALDAKSLDFADQSERVIEQRVEIYQSMLNVEADFDRAVAVVLTSDQWEIWKKFLREEETRGRSRGPRDGDGDRRRPPPR
ncbi:MAG: hypothetical protein ACSHXK_06000 [Oceanococcus sp.]